MIASSKPKITESGVTKFGFRDLQLNSSIEFNFVFCVSNGNRCVKGARKVCQQRPKFACLLTKKRKAKRKVMLMRCSNWTIGHLRLFIRLSFPRKSVGWRSVGRHMANLLAKSSWFVLLT